MILLCKQCETYIDENWTGVTACSCGRRYERISPNTVVTMEDHGDYRYYRTNDGPWQLWVKRCD